MKSLPYTAFALLVSLTVVSCKQDDGGRARSLQSEVDALQEKQFEAQAAAKRLKAQIEASRAERTKLEAERDKASAERDAAKKEVEQLKKDFENYKSLYKVSIRKRAPGMKLEDFAVDGAVYKAVAIRELTESMVSFTHDSGVKKMDLRELPAHLQSLLGFSTEVAREVKTETLSRKEIGNQKRIAYLEAEKMVAAARDQLDEAKRRLGDAQSELRNRQLRREPVAEYTRYVDQLNSACSRLEVQLTEAYIREREIRNTVEAQYR